MLLAFINNQENKLDFMIIAYNNCFYSMKTKLVLKRYICYVHTNAVIISLCIIMTVDLNNNLMYREQYQDS